MVIIAIGIHKNIVFLRFAFLFLSSLLAKLPAAFGQELTFSASGNVAGRNYINIQYLKNMSLIKDSVYLISGKSSKFNLHLSQPAFIRVKYKTLNKRIYVFPSAKLLLHIILAKSDREPSRMVVIGDYSINDYLDSIESNEVLTGYINSRIKDVSGPIDSLSQILQNYRLFSDSIRFAYFTKRYKPVKHKALSVFLSIDSINSHYYSILAAADYLRIFKHGNKNRFYQSEIVSKIRFGNPDFYLTSEFYERSWIFIIRAAFDHALQEDDSATVQLRGFIVFGLDYIHSNRISGKLKDVILSQLFYDEFSNYSEVSAEERVHSYSLFSPLITRIEDDNVKIELISYYQSQRKFVNIHRKGAPAPYFKFIDSLNKAFTLNNFKGKVILLNIWASWCLPCIKEFPYLQKLENELKQNGEFRMISVSIDEQRENWLKAIVSLRPPGLHVLIYLNAKTQPLG